MGGARPTLDLLRSCERDAMHLEMRDAYTPEDPAWRAWQTGNRANPLGDNNTPWFNLIVETVRRGVWVRRARIVSEPVTEYIRFEHAVTAGYNIKAGEQVRWLARQRTAGLAVPPSDFWVFDGRTVVWNHFAGDGTSQFREVSEDPEIARLCAESFETVWARAIPHEEYQLT